MRDVATEKLDVNHDPKGDVLYVSIGTPRPSYCEEPETGVLFRYAFDDGAFTGVTVLAFRQRWASGALPSLSFPVPIDLGAVARAL
jgi:hypothetical protein